MPVNGVLPIVSVCNSSGTVTSSQILLNGNGNYVIQADGVTPGDDYYLAVSAAPAPAPSVGNYSLVAGFGTVPYVVQTFGEGSLTSPSNQQQYTLYVAQTQLFQFVLATAAAPSSSTDLVTMTITNSSGQVVFSSTGGLNQTFSGASVILLPGAYSVSISAVSTVGAALPSISFPLFGASISDAIGIAPSDPVEEPM